MIRILAVDDEKPITELLRLTLGRAGYQCVCAYDGSLPLAALLLMTAETSASRPQMAWIDRNLNQ